MNYYDDYAEQFCQDTRIADMQACRADFLSVLGDNGHILDAGCGSGRDAKAFLEAGYQVTAIDASSRMCEEAGRWIGIPIQCMSFEEMDFDQKFEGIWACASLLHVKRVDMDDVLRRCHHALKVGGVMYASFKQGKGERFQGERFFNNYMEEELYTLFEHNGFTVIKIYITRDVREGREQERWVNALVRK